MTNCAIILSQAERGEYNKLFYKNKEAMRSEITLFYSKKIELKKKSVQSLKAKKADALRAFEAQAEELSSQVAVLQRSMSKMLTHYDLTLKKLERIEEESELQTREQIPPKMTLPLPTPSEEKPVFHPPSEATTEAVAEPEVFKQPEKKRRRLESTATITNKLQIPQIENLDEILEAIDMTVEVISEREIPKDPRKKVIFKI